MQPLYLIINDAGECATRSYAAREILAETASNCIGRHGAAYQKAAYASNATSFTDAAAASTAYAGVAVAAASACVAGVPCARASKEVCVERSVI